MTETEASVAVIDLLCSLQLPSVMEGERCAAQAPLLAGVALRELDVEPSGDDLNWRHMMHSLCERSFRLALVHRQAPDALCSLQRGEQGLHVQAIGRARDRVLQRQREAPSGRVDAHDGGAHALAQHKVPRRVANEAVRQLGQPCIERPSLRRQETLK